jgi:alpha-beta hydrolase superfamily lysophospholipase
MMKPPETTGNLTADNGVSLFYRHRPAETEHARLVLAHGLGEHSGRYTHVIDRLAELGVSVWAMDHQGHGQRGGSRGHIDCFDQYLKDLKQMIDLAKNGAPDGMKCFLLGHSMGGLIALRFTETYKDAVDGVIASSPGLAPAMKIPAIKGGAAKLISNLWPTLTFDNELDPSHLSHDPAIVQAYINDPLVNRRISARWFTEFLSAMDATNSDVAAIHIPILMQVAGSDRLVDSQTSKNFFESLTTKDKTLFFYDDLYHEIYNELGQNRKKVLDDLIKWTENHI